MQPAPDSLRDLGPQHLDSTGTYATVLEGLLIQSPGPAPDFVDSGALHKPHVAWSTESAGVRPRSRTYAFASDPPIVSPEVWLGHVAAARMRPERRAVASELATFADRDTGRNVRPAVKTIAARIGRARENVNRHIRNLVTESWLLATGKAPRGVLIYALALPESVTQPVKKKTDRAGKPGPSRDRRTVGRQARGLTARAGEEVSEIHGGG